MGTRIRRHGLLAGLTAVGCLLAYWYKPTTAVPHILTIGLGYVAIILLVATLVIGPWKLRTWRRTPANLYLRRDIGIWCGITGLLHTWFGFQVHFRGDIVRYFFEVDEDEYTPILDAFGLANYLGVVAALVLTLLLLLSNDLSLRALRGPLWKRLQQFNYLLVVLVLVHTLAYQVVVRREPPFVAATLGLTLVFLVAQGVGMRLYLRNRSTREPSVSS